MKFKKLMCFNNVLLQKISSIWAKKKKAKKNVFMSYTLFTTASGLYTVNFVVMVAHTSGSLVAENFELLKLSLDLFSKYM